MLLRNQDDPEERANSVSHGIGFLAAIASGPVLLWTTAQRGNWVNLVGAGVFVVTMALLYFASAIYHACPPGRMKRLFVKLDHSAIYLFIAGTYTPFAIGVLQGWLGWSLLAAIWTLAIMGVSLKASNRLSHPALSTGLYLAMGWLGILAVGPILARMGVEGLGWIAAGGMAYTIGVIFFTLDDRLRYGHFVWHLFVMAGSACHFVAVLNHAI